MSGPAIAPHAAAQSASAASLIATKFTKPGHASGQTMFDALLQKLSTRDAQASAGDGTKRETNDPARFDAAKEEDGAQDGAKAGDSKIAPAADPAATIAALLAPQTSADAGAVAIAALLAPPTSTNADAARVHTEATAAVAGGANAEAFGAKAAPSATQAWAARLQAQSQIAGGARGSDGALMPSDSTAQVALAATPTVAPEIVGVHVESARTFLGLDNSTPTTKLNAETGAPTISPSNSAKAPSPAATDGMQNAAVTLSAAFSTGGAVSDDTQPAGAAAAWRAWANYSASNDPNGVTSSPSDVRDVNRVASKDNSLGLLAGAVQTDAAARTKAAPSVEAGTASGAQTAPSTEVGAVRADAATRAKAGPSVEAGTGSGAQAAPSAEAGAQADAARTKAAPSVKVGTASGAQAAPSPEVGAVQADAAARTKAAPSVKVGAASGAQATPSTEVGAVKTDAAAMTKAAPSVKVGTASGAQAAPSTEAGAAPTGSNTGRQSGGGAMQRERSNAPGGSQGGLTNAASSAGAAVAASAVATSASGVAGASAATVFGPLTVDQLPDLIANQGAALAGWAPTAASSGATTANLNPVKELKVQLNPADLGSMTVKMRLANGNLAVVIETAKDSTAKMIEGERDAIAERLASVDQPVASVTVQASGGVPHQGENNNGSGVTPQQGDPQNSTPNSENGQARSSRGDNGQGEAGQANSADDQTSGRALSGDLFV
jgi:chemotaxis protein MotD